MDTQFLMDILLNAESTKLDDDTTITYIPSCHRARIVEGEKVRWINAFSLANAMAHYWMDLDAKTFCMYE